MTERPRPISTAEAARELGISAVTLARWARQGKVRPALATPGGRGVYRWDLADLRRQIDEANRPAEPGPDHSNG